MKKANLKDVAALAGVSQGTASRVLNNLPVRKDSHTRVARAIKELNYTPNLLARSLRIASSNTIGIVVADISSPIAALLVSNMQSMAYSRNHDVVFYNTKAEPIKELEAIRIFVEKRVTGIVFTSNTMTEQTEKVLNESGIPYVLVSTSYNGMTSVTIDNVKAAYDAVSFLARKGHRNIAMLSGPLSDPNAGSPRYNGYRQAMLDAGLTPDDRLVCFGRYRMTDGYDGAQELVERRLPFTALFCASDELAIGAIKMLGEYGLRIPADVSVMGFDGISFGSFITPTLTTVKQPFEELGRVAVEMLFKKIDGDSELQSVVLNHRLQIESSVIEI